MRKMVKKGEYFDFAVELEKRTVDFNPIIQPKGNEITLSTEMSIVVEMAKKVKELEARLVIQESK